jgi:hypothetical protein
MRLLCPARLPRATLALPPGRGFRPPPLVARRQGDGRRLGRWPLLGVEFSYGAPVEPSRAWRWRRHLWWNRPCCFLHLGVYRLVGRLPSGTRPVTIAGRRGWFLPATSHGLGARGLWWDNHVWFFWRDSGAPYVATLHYFGRGFETRRLLARLVRALRPVARL